MTLTTTHVQLIENALSFYLSLDDCAVLNQTNDAGQVETIAYLGTLKALSLDEINQTLKSTLGDMPLPHSYVQMPKLPRTVSGEIDTEQLKQTAIVDDHLVNKCEQSLQQALDTEQIAVSEHWLSTPTAHLHLQDILPEGLLSQKASSHQVSEQALNDRPASTTSTQLNSDKVDTLAIANGVPLQDDLAPNTLTEMLKQAAQQHLSSDIIFINQETTTSRLSYGELLSAADCMLAGLRSAGLKAGDAVILLLEENQDILISFWGCLLGGMMPVIMTVPATYDASQADAQKLRHVWQALGQPSIVINATQTKTITSWPEALPIKPEQLCVYESMITYSPDNHHHKAAPDDVAFMTLTSGSTGGPKCVMMTHRNIISRARGTNKLCQHHASDTILNWLPLDHIGSISDWHLRCVLLGCNMIYAPTSLVLASPTKWLDLINQYRVSHTWAANFAYKVIIEQLAKQPSASWDLSCVKSMLSAGEPVAGDVVNGFLSALAPWGLPKTAICPAFGMAEMGSGITYFLATEQEPYAIYHVDRDSLEGTLQPLSAKDPRSIGFTCLGNVIPGVSVRIVNDNNNIISERKIGRLQVKGDPVMPGYFNNPDANADVLLSSGWFDTGDRGFLLDGRLYVTGRNKETILVNGVNYYVGEIESATEAIEGVAASYTAACAVRPKGSSVEKFALFFNAPSAASSQLAPLIHTIAGEIAKKVGAKPDYILPVEQAVIPKTAIGKIQRKQLTQRFESGEFDALIKQTDVMLENEQTIPDWFLKPVWQAKQIQHFIPENQTRKCLIFNDKTVLATKLANALTLAGHQCISVDAGTEFNELNPTRYLINPSAPEDYITLFKTINSHNIQVCTILHLASYAAYAANGLNLQLNDQALAAGLYSLLFLTQAIAQLPKDNQPQRLLVASSHAQAIHHNETICPERTALIGFLKTIPHELPWLSYTHIDLPWAPQDNHQRSLLAECTALSNDEEIAYRNNQRLIRQLKPVAWQHKQDSNYAMLDQGIVLITGGLGGIGVAIASHLLITQPSVKILLVGRTPLPSKATKNQDVATAGQRIKDLQQLQALGDVRYENVDITDHDALTSLVSMTEHFWQSKLRGVVHLAGHKGGEPIIKETQPGLEAVLGPKLAGALAIQSLINDRPDCVMLNFSSVISTLGGQSMGAYASANRALEAVTHMQNRAGLRSYCMDWSAWDDIGMSKGAIVKSMLRDRGMYTLSKDSALLSFTAMMRQLPGQYLIGLDTNNQQMQKRMVYQTNDQQSLLAFYANDSDKSIHALQALADGLMLTDRFGTPISCQLRHVPSLPLTASATIDRVQLKALALGEVTEPFEAANTIEKTLETIWLETLKLDAIETETDFFRLGGDSLTSVVAQMRIKQELNIHIDPSLIYEQPKLQDLAKVIASMQQDDPITDDTNTSETVRANTLVDISPEGWQDPLFIMPGIIGEPEVISETVELLGPEQPVYGLRIPLPIDESIERITEHFCDDICERFPTGNVSIFGYSVAGVFAYELAQQLTAKGRTINLLTIVDAGPGKVKRNNLHAKITDIGMFFQNIPRYFADDLRQMSLKDWEELFQRKTSTLYRKIAPRLGVKKQLAQNLQSDDIFVTDSWPAEFRERVNAILATYEKYQYRPYQGDMVLLRAYASPLLHSYSDDLGWRNYLQGKLSIQRTSGNHHSITKAPHVYQLAKMFKNMLEESNQQAAS